MKIETDMPTYKRLKRCLSERFPDVKVQLITSDPMLKKLGFAEKVPCTIDVIATDNQAEQIMDDAIDLEVRAFMIDDENSEEWKQYEQYGWLFDFFCIILDIRGISVCRHQQERAVILFS